MWVLEVILLFSMVFGVSEHSVKDEDFLEMKEKKINKRIQTDKRKEKKKAVIFTYFLRHVEQIFHITSRLYQ